MNTSASSSNDSLVGSSPPSLSISTPLWVVSVTISVLAGWAIYNFVPFRFELPARLAGLNPMGDKTLLDEAAMLTAKNRFWNGLNTFAILGACFGASSILVGFKSPIRILPCVLLGAASGCLAAVLGMVANGYLESLESIPGIDESTRPIAIEVVSYTLASTLLAIPFAMVFWLFGSVEQRRAGKSIIASGIVAGGLFPIVMSVAFPSVSLMGFPAFGWQATLIWLTAFGALILIMSSLGSRKAAPIDLEQKEAKV